MIKLTENAVKEIKKIQEEQSIEGYLRVGVVGGGCSGFQYSIAFDDSDIDSKVDKQWEQDGLQVVVDRKSELYLDGTTIDFYEDLNQRGFKFENPNSTHSCGCGKSFS